VSKSHHEPLVGSLLGTELSLSSRGRMTLEVGAIFRFISHTMSCQPKGLGLHIYSWPRQPNICQDGEQIRKLVLGVDVARLEVPFLQAASDEVVPHPDVLAPFMKNGVLC
jgi:hypothetical protein